MDPPRVQPYESIPLDPEQERKLLATLKGDRLEALFTVPIAVGLRPGEALLEPRYVAHYFKGVLKLAGLPDSRVYDLRHTCATLLLCQGVHPWVVMEILGHSQISLTMNTYSHVIPQMQEEAATKMDDLMSGNE